MASWTGLLTLATALIQAGLGVGAWKLANALKERVDDHETRLTLIEGRSYRAPGKKRSK